MEFDGLSLQLNSPNLEINTNSRDVALRISVVSKSKEQARLFWESAGAVDKKATFVPFRRLNHR